MRHGDIVSLSGGRRIIRSLSDKKPPFGGFLSLKAISFIVSSGKTSSTFIISYFPFIAINNVDICFML